ncbi:MAG: flippase [Desulfobacteraceae bacterium]|nr:flippase [Desulfobacteraceae bacterium]
MEKQQIIRNTFALFMGNGLSNLLSFFLMVFIARLLGDVGVGQYSFIFAFGSLIVLLGNPGLEYLIVKEVSADKGLLPTYGGNILSLKMILSVLAVSVTVALSLFVNKSQVVIYSLLIVCIIYGFDVVGSTFSRILHANERMDLTSLAEVAERVIALGLGVIVLYQTRSILYLVLALLVSRVVREVIYFYFSNRYFIPVLRGDWLIWKELFIKSISFSLSIFFLYIYYRIDTVMLSLMVNDQVTGWYNAAYRLVDVVNYIPFLIVTAILPPMARSSKKDKDLLRDLFNRSLRYLIILAAPIGLGTYLLAPRIIQFVYGEGFSNAAFALKILIWAEVLVFVNYLGGQLLNVIDKQKAYTMIIGITAGVNILLNVILIPKYTYIGASVATLLCEVVVFILVYQTIRRFFIKVNLLPLLWRPILGSIGMGIVILKTDFLPLWYAVPIGAISYFLLFFLLGGFNEQDKETLTDILSMVGLKRA